MPRTRGFANRSGMRPRAQRRMDWVGAARDGFVEVAAETSSQSYLVLPTQVATFTDATLVRTRGIFVVQSVALLGLQVGFHGAAGITVWDDVNDTVPAAGQAPDPFIDPNHDWLWHSYFGRTGGSSASGTHPILWEAVVDSKAMRRMGSTKGVLAIVRNAHSEALNCFFAARCLFKE